MRRSLALVVCARHMLLVGSARANREVRSLCGPHFHRSHIVLDTHTNLLHVLDTDEYARVSSPGMRLYGGSDGETSEKGGSGGPYG
jgi:hypothetical protein